MTRWYFLIIYMTILISVFMVYHVDVESDTVYSQETEEFTRHLTRAVKAAVSSNEYEQVGQIMCLFDSEEKREKAATLFFNTFEQGLNYINDSNMRDDLKMHVPVLALIDTDGYYIVYNAPYNASDGVAFKSTITPINTWSAASRNNAYLIRYYLSDYVEVYDTHANQYITGQYDEVYQKMGCPVGLEDFASEERFQEAKNDIIIQELQDNIEHYINEYNYTVNSYSKNGIRTEYDLHYNFTLPKVAYEDWCGLIESPSSMAFYQGIQIPNTNRDLNIYAMCGGKLLLNKGYYITKSNGEYVYHKVGCSLLEGSDKRIYRKTKEACAKQGAFPCKQCNP